MNNTWFFIILLVVNQYCHASSTDQLFAWQNPGYKSHKDFLGIPSDTTLKACPIHKALEATSLEELPEALAGLEDINKCCCTGGVPPLTAAVRLLNPDAVRCILELPQVDVFALEDRDKERSALAELAQKSTFYDDQETQRITAITALLFSKVGPLIVQKEKPDNDRSEYLLHRAIEHCCVPMVKSLLAAGANPNAHKDNHKNPFRTLCHGYIYPHALRIQKEDFDAGESCKLYVYDYNTGTLHKKPTHAQWDIGLALVNAGADTSTQVRSGESYIDYALSQQQNLTAKLLFAAGAPISKEPIEWLKKPSHKNLLCWALACQRLHGKNDIESTVTPEYLQSLEPVIKQQMNALQQDAQINQFFKKADKQIPDKQTHCCIS